MQINEIINFSENYKLLNKIKNDFLEALDLLNDEFEDEENKCHLFINKKLDEINSCLFNMESITISNIELFIIEHNKNMVKLLNEIN